MQSGLLYLKETWEPDIYAKESGLWPTPTVNCVEGGEQSNRVEKTKKGSYILRKKGKSHMTYGAKLSDAVLFEEKKETFPTPTTQEVEHPNMKLTTTGRRQTKDGKNSHSLNLADTVQKFPTPQSRDYKGPSGRSMKGLEKDLPSVVEKFPTPIAGDWKGQVRSKGEPGMLSGIIEKQQKQDSVKEQPTGRLNPTWVEWLMGFPLEWTELKD